MNPRYEKMETGKRNETELWADEVINRIRNKMARVSEKNRNKIPYTTDENGN